MNLQMELKGTQKKLKTAPASKTRKKTKTDILDYIKYFKCLIIRFVFYFIFLKKKEKLQAPILTIYILHIFLENDSKNKKDLINF